VSVRKLCLFLFIFVSACDPDPARSVRILARPIAESTAVQSSVSSSWHPAGCPPVVEKTSGAGNLQVAGPCAFEHHQIAKCKAKADDFFVFVDRVGANGGKLGVYVNVEHYHGPGSYLLSIAHITLQDGSLLYRWSSDNISVVVGADEAFVELPTTRLSAEPLMNSCPPVVAPDGSYHFPCTARRLKSALDGTQEILRGRIICAKEEPEDRVQSLGD